MHVEQMRFDSHLGWTPWTARIDPPRTLFLVFGAEVQLAASEPLRMLVAAYPGAHFAGCVTSSVYSAEGHADGQLAVTALTLEDSIVRVVDLVTRFGEAGFDVGRRLGSLLREDDLRGVLVLFSGRQRPGRAFLEGLHSQVPPGVPVAGTASVGTKDIGLVAGSRLLRDGVVGIGLYGDTVRVGVGSSSPDDGAPTEFRVTAARGFQLETLEGEAAHLRIGRDLAASGRDPGDEVPLLLVAEDGGALPGATTRRVTGLDGSTGCVLLDAPLSAGAIVSFLRSPRSQLADSARRAAEHARLAAGIYPRRGDLVAVTFSTESRRDAFGSEVHREVAALIEGLPLNAVPFGLHGAAALATDLAGRPDLLCHGMAVMTIAEG